PWRAVVIGSSSWSHATLTRKTHYLWPDTEADRRRLREVQTGQFSTWRDLDPKEIVDAGQHEILNWICLAGAMEGRKADVRAYAETYLFNSSKAVVLFPVEGAPA
ncbi:MAG TPA: extradiol ring-cleavage dioxygenase, partial [Chloroflexota bacterium]|nr:extradiol ring-cleavage dioxygenase [Chloroflexota bacterium]